MIDDADNIEDAVAGLSLDSELEGDCDDLMRLSHALQNYTDINPNNTDEAGFTISKYFFSSNNISQYMIENIGYQRTRRC